MPEPQRLRTTADGCVSDNDVVYLASRPQELFRVQTPNGPVTRAMVRIAVLDRLMLADVSTGTLYDPKTGQCNSPRLKIIGKAK